MVRRRECAGSPTSHSLLPPAHGSLRAHCLPQAIDERPLRAMDTHGVPDDPVGALIHELGGPNMVAELMGSPGGAGPGSERPREQALVLAEGVLVSPNPEPDPRPHPNPYPYPNPNRKRNPTTRRRRRSP